MFFISSFVPGATSRTKRQPGNDFKILKRDPSLRLRNRRPSCQQAMPHAPSQTAINFPQIYCFYCKGANWFARLWSKRECMRRPFEVFWSFWAKFLQFCGMIICCTFFWIKVRGALVFLDIFELDFKKECLWYAFVMYVKPFCIKIYLDIDSPGCELSNKLTFTWFYLQLITIHSQLVAKKMRAFQNSKNYKRQTLYLHTNLYIFA